MSHDKTVLSLQQALYTFYSPSDFAKLPVEEWLVEKVFPARGIACIFGPSRSGKTFLATDLLVAVVTGSPWFGRKTKKSKVLYMAVEAPVGVRKRIAAWEKHNEQLLPDSEAKFMFDSFRLNVDKDVEKLVNSIKVHQGVNVVVIDTLNRAAPSVDENSSQGMGKLIDAASRIQTAIDGLVIIVHHTGKNPSKGMRGHTSLDAALDAAIAVDRDSAIRSWTIDKAKDAEDGQSFGFVLEPVVFENEDGTTLASCVVKPTGELVLAQSTPGKSLKPNEAIAYPAILDLLEQSTLRGQGGAPSDTPCVEWEHVIDALKLRFLTHQPKHQRERAKEAVNGLLNKRYLAADAQRIWLWRPSDSKHASPPTGHLSIRGIGREGDTVAMDDFSVH